MIELSDIPDPEFTNYAEKLIPRLLHKEGKWVKILDLTQNPNRFIEVVQCLADYRYFDNKAGFCMIEIDATSTRIRVNSFAPVQRLRDLLNLEKWKFQK